MKGARAAWPALLAAGIALSAWQWHEATEAPSRHHGHAHLHDDSGKPARLYAWTADQAARVTLATPAGSVDVTRGPQGWVASPREGTQGGDAVGSDAAGPDVVGLDAAGFDAADFVALFSQARSDRILMPEAGETYGLAPPQLRIEVSDAAGARLAQLDVGELAPDGLGRYVRLPDEAQIRIIPDYQTRAPLAAMAVMGQGGASPASTPPLVKPALRKDK